MIYLKNFLITIIRIPWGILLLIPYLYKLLVEAIYKQAFKDEIAEEKMRRRNVDERVLELKSTTKTLSEKNYMLEESMSELNELKERGYALLGIHIKTIKDYFRKELPFYFVYINKGDRKLFDMPKAAFEALCSANHSFDLLKYERETIIIRGHLPGKFKKYRSARPYEVFEPELEKPNHVVYVEGRYFLDWQDNKFKILLWDIYSREYKNIGLGSLGLSYLVGLAKERNVQQIYGDITKSFDPEIRQKLRNFYEKNGFTVTNNEGNNKLDTFIMDL
ncbi:MAG TPA: hypothetical protein VF691_04160 [Cytophagaceae bacterium]|jgi:GNAT superfamily N-acetyltransferase